MRAAFGTVAYGFWPMRHTPYEVAAAGIHSVDERVHVDDLGYATRFHVEACRETGARGSGWWWRSAHGARVRRSRTAR